MDTSARSENHEHDGFWGFPEMKSISPKMTQNNHTELSGYSFNEIYSRNDPPDRQTQHPQFVRDFPRFSIGNKQVKQMPTLNSQFH